jgi:signal transduction histidine kinase/CheY-like chemotaxis protein
VTGALFIGALPLRVLSENDVRLASTFADQAASAIANAELFRETERANRAKDEFLAMLGHELRNPLNALGSAASLLALEDGNAEMRDRARGVINRQVQHLARLVDDLLDVSRVTSGKVVLMREPTDLGELAVSTIANWRASGRFARHQVSLETVPGVWVDVDPTRLDQVLGNLLHNALKYTPVGGAVAVRVRPEGDVALLEVADNGVGIPAELLGKIFDLFVQGERTLDRSQGGLGIGLTLTRALVEMHSGTVEARSGGTGRGATFTLRLPRIPGSVRPIRSVTPPVAAAPRRIVLIEDNVDAREMLRAQLEREGHQVSVAGDGPTGVETAAATRPDVVLIDVGLPGFDGYEVARRIRATDWGKSMRLVALTGYGQADDRREAVESGCDLHVTKPVMPERLAEILADADGERSAPPPPR